MLKTSIYMKKTIIFLSDSSITWRIICFFLGSRILIVGGISSGSYNYTSYLIKVHFDDNTITKIEYKDLPNVPDCFICFGSFENFMGRTLIIGGFKSKGVCFEIDQEQYQVIPSLHVDRFYAASTFIQNKIVVAGGLVKITNLINSIEILDWDESNHQPRWIESPSRLPIKVRSHTLVTLNDKLYLIGGYNGSNRLDTIWIGTFDLQCNKISWVNLGLRLQEQRCYHFSFVISNAIIIFGGLVAGEDFIEILEENKLKQGPKVPFRLSTFNGDQAVLDLKIGLSLHHKTMA